MQHIVRMMNMQRMIRDRGDGGAGGALAPPLFLTAKIIKIEI